MDRQIIHVDMDEFFAAVEKIDRPELAGKPLLVGGAADKRGVVATASYEARAFGCHSAMPMAKAVRLCPQAIVLPVRGQRYGEISDSIFDIFHRFSPLVEPLSIDEAFLDVTGCQRLLGPAEEIARKIKQAVRTEIGLTASLGVAPNKFLAKLASDLKKPDGLVVIRPAEVQALLDNLPVTKLWGVGPAAAKLFTRLNVRTIGQLRRVGLDVMKSTFGSSGEHFWDLAHGRDDRSVEPDSQAKSIGHEDTFAVDIGDLDDLRRVLLGQVEQVGRRLRRHELKARTVTLKLRYGDFTTLTRSRTMPTATSTTAALWQAAEELFTAWAGKDFRPLRLLGMTASNLGTGSGQLSLFDQAQADKQEKLDKTLDDITNRFGNKAVRRGGE
ncbi:MAG: DNA polymerase IV [Planctomycetaceae bacterium]|nr:MAG: DNA polymerase IV [Planctomycetaceae bacterium]